MKARVKVSKRIEGIVAASKALKICRQHLRLVILGERQSPELLARFREWRAMQ
jgi:hypothetical protein